MNQKYQINPDWKRLASQIVMPNQRVLLLGQSDVGKSTFCRYLIDYACAKSLKAALIDADIGQSQIGPPTTIGMKLFDKKPEGAKLNTPFGGYEDDTDDTSNKSKTGKKELNDGHHLDADALYFVGAISPLSHLLPVLTGTRLMIDACKDQEVDFTVIDTTGFVDGGAAVMLKQQKIDILRPHHVVCIGRPKDLDNIVSCYSNQNWLTLHYMLPHKLVRTKSSETRKKHRTVKFETYFADSELQTVPFERIRGKCTPFFNGRIANQQELDILTGLTEEEVLYAEWGHRTLSLIARRNLTQYATNHLKNYLSLSHIEAETHAYFEQRLVGLINDEGNTLAIGIIGNIDFQNHELNIRCKSGTVAKTIVLQFGDYRFPNHI